MLVQIRNFFKENLAPSAAATAAESKHRLQLAVGALLLEMTRVDGEVRPEQCARVEAAIREHFDLSSDETATLIRLAEAERDGATDYFQFTTLIKDEYTPEQREQVVEQLWAVALADRELHRYEEHLVRKIAQLLHVPQSAFSAVKHRGRGRSMRQSPSRAVGAGCSHRPAPIGTFGSQQMKVLNAWIRAVRQAVIPGLISAIAMAALSSCALQQEAAESEAVSGEPRIVRQVDRPLSPGPGGDGERMFRDNFVRGTLSASGHWQLRGEVVHPRLRCASYQFGLRFGSGDASCDDTDWSAGLELLPSRLQCNNATVIHSGEGTIGVPPEEISALNCVRVVVRCTGACG